MVVQDLDIKDKAYVLLNQVRLGLDKRKIPVVKAAIAVALAGTLAGCSSPTKEEETTSTTEISTQAEETAEVVEESPLEEVVDEQEASTAVEKAVEIMVNEASELSELAKAGTESEAFERGKEQSLSNFELIVDWLKDEKPIAGYYRHDVTEGTVEVVTEALTTIDETIEKHFPDYKENVKEKLSELGDKLWDLSTSAGATLMDKGSQWLDEMEQKRSERGR